MNKKGQFYLVAAMLIVLVVSGFAGVSSYALINAEPQTINEVREDLSRESYHIIEYGVYNEQDVTTLETSFIGEQMGNFFLEKTQDANIVFIYGNKKNLKALQYDRGSQGDISVGGSGWISHAAIARIKDLGDVSGQDSVFVELLNNTYSFAIKDNQLFYFVIVKESDEGVYVTTSDKKIKKPESSKK